MNFVVVSLVLFWIVNAFESAWRLITGVLGGALRYILKPRFCRHCNFISSLSVHGLMMKYASKYGIGP